MNGWISLHRKITEHWIWQDPIKFQWWIDMLLMVNHEDNKLCIGMQLIECKRGQTVMSLSNWAKRWGVSRDTARNFLVLLERDGMITTENLVKSTRITICNYEAYQTSLHAEQTPSKRKPNANQTLADINNNDNNLNNDNTDNKGIGEKAKRFVPPTIDEIKIYCLERKNKVDPEKFFNFYQSKGWLVGKSKMKDWKASIHTWEKSEKTQYEHPSAAHQQQNSNTDSRF